jgi:hypothetical protein
MNVHSFWDAVGAVIVLAIVATVLTKSNTSADVTAAGSSFSGVLTSAEAG